MKVSLLTPPGEFPEGRDLVYGCWCGGKRSADAEYPPLDLVSIATMLEKSGHYTNIGPDGNADIVICPVSAATLEGDRGYLKKIKENNPNCKTIAFGAAATLQTKKLLETGVADFAIIGEPEYAIKNLVGGIGTKGWEKTKGMAYLKDNTVRTNPPAPLPPLDPLPIPDRKMLHKKDYFNPLVTKKPWTTMITTRGCAGRCTFCLSHKFYGGAVRARSVGKVIEELTAIRAQGYKEVFFRDETFTWNWKRTREICEKMIEERLDLAWVANAKVGTVDRKTLHLMKEAGCEVLKIGVESGNQQILDNIKKGITLKQTEETFRWTKEVGIRTHAHLMLGCPGETKKTIWETIEFAKKIGSDTATFGILTPYPGTEIFEGIKSRIKITDFSGEHAKAHYNELFTELSKEELEKALKTAYREFYFRPKYILSRIQKIRSMQDLHTLIKSGLAVTQFSGS